ncbi:unnamed protein product [Ambrosiozyma monospora]|uniref:Unnamed protein product n=1 Tax=Ambrosiozyma monospora TaxID=43982 RepID=A0ACB5T1Y6_AMBMO|nr:unnamed protein product [Ambrosiozyma monospora]
MNYAGHITHAGYVGLIDNITKENALHTDILYEAGAIFYIRTTQCQSMMQICSGKNYIGLCRNPCNTNLTPGGSSSGEAAICALKGGAMSVGSDIVGSVRAPASFCGVWGLKPTSKRLSNKNSTAAGYCVPEEVYPTFGPICRSAEDIDLFMRVSIGGKPWESDPDMIPLPWRDVPLPNVTDLKVAVVYDDGFVKPTVPIQRGLKIAVEKLKAADVKVVEWSDMNVEREILAISNCLNGDAGTAQKEIFRKTGEPVWKLTQIWSASGCGGKGISFIKGHQETAIRNAARARYNDKMKELDVDFILSPTNCNVAGIVETPWYWGYTSIWNFVDFPNMAFPTGFKADPKIDVPLKDFKARNEVEQYEQDLYNNQPEMFKGAPICLQLTGKRWFDEEVVKASQVVHQIIAV